MGVVKLLLPKFIYHRKFLPANRNWKRNTLLAIVQTNVLSFLIWRTTSRNIYRMPRAGKDLVDENGVYAKPIRPL